MDRAILESLFRNNKLISLPFRHSPTLARGLNPAEIFASCPAPLARTVATLRAFEFPVPCARDR